MLAQHLCHARGQRGHVMAVIEAVLQPGQARQQVQRVNTLWRLELRGGQVHVAGGGGNVTVAQQAADSEQIHPAFKQMSGKAVAQGVGAAGFTDACAVARGLVGALQVLDVRDC